MGATGGAMSATGPGSTVGGEVGAATTGSVDGGGATGGSGAGSAGGAVGAATGDGGGPATTTVSEASSPAEELATTGSMAPHDLQKRRVASFASPQSGH